jgi:hypothetical protein
MVILSVLPVQDCKKLEHGTQYLEHAKTQALL